MDGFIKTLNLKLNNIKINEYKKWVNNLYFIYKKVKKNNQYKKYKMEQSNKKNMSF